MKPRKKKRNGRHTRSLAHLLDAIRLKFPKVRHIKDATEPLVLNVTDADVKGARKKEHSKCVMAQACKRVAEGAVVSLSRLYLISGETATRYISNHHIARELVSFDRSGVFAPGEYVLNAPTESHLIGTPREGPPSSPSGERPLRRHHITKGVRTALR